jgi:hypothetical protein
LITCFFIVYHHGGRITAEHDEGKGNTFTLTFPLTPSVQAAALEEKDFIGKVLLNEAMWEKLMVEV